MVAHVVILFVLALWTHAATSKVIPDFIEVCKLNDPNINSCLKKAIQDAIPYFSKGIPELDMPTGDPFHIENIHMKHGGNAIFFDLFIYNGSSIGASRIHINDVSFSPEERRLQIDMSVPGLTSTIAHYKSKGRILVVPLSGNGRFNISTYQSHSTLDMTFKPTVRDGVTYWKVDKITVKTQGEKYYVHMSNLFNGNVILEQTMNAFLNENAHEIFQEVRPTIEASFAKAIKDYSNKFFQQIPVAEIFPES